MNQLGPIRQRGAACTGPQHPTINYSPHPMVAKIFKTES